MLPMEVTLAQIWQQVLEVEQVGRFDDYFVLGGDSILSIPELPPGFIRGVIQSPLPVECS
jgi:hypothetical protein